MKRRIDLRYAMGSLIGWTTALGQLEHLALPLLQARRGTCQGTCQLCLVLYTGTLGSSCFLKRFGARRMPVQQATKVELHINLKTANTLGITIPLPLSGRADELIE